MMLETAHYSGSFEKALRQGRAVINLRVTRPLMLADFSSHSRYGLDYLSRLETRKNVRAALSALAGKRLWDLMLSPTDYSVSRAIGLAAGCHHYLDGILFTSARTTPEIPTGDNIVLFGNHGSVVSTRLSIDSVLLYQGGRGKGVNPFIKHDF